MRFLFVDSVSRFDETQIAGRRVYPADEPLRYPVFRDVTEVSPGVVSEAVGQLASWLCLKRNDFTARPVFLFADRIEMPAATPTGAAVDLTATIHDFDVQSFRFSGEARVGGTLVHRIENCSGYFMPLGDLEDPEVTRRRFDALVGGGLKLDGHGGPAYDFAGLAGETVDLTPGGQIRTRRQMAAVEPFYADHFPRFPVTPIVMLTEMIGSATARLTGATNDSPRRLRGREATSLKIRNFVRPGDTVETLVRLKSPVPQGAGFVETVAEVFKDGKPILRGAYKYEIIA